MVKDRWNGESQHDVDSRNRHDVEQRNIQNQPRTNRPGLYNFFGDTLKALIECFYWL